MNRHERFEELISASLTGDLSDEENEQLQAHLRGCPDCRSTLDAFTGGRRLVAGLRHRMPPRDLGARVRTGVQRGAFTPIPWWRRPAAVFVGVAGSAAVVAGALLAVVVMNAAPDDRQVGRSPGATPTVSLAPSPSATAAPTPAPQASASLSPVPQPTATPTPIPPEPETFLALTGPVESPTLTVNEGDTGQPTATLSHVSGPPIAATLSTDGEWLAYTTLLGESGQVEVWLARTGDGDATSLGRWEQGSPFMEQLSWSPDGRFLAFTTVTGRRTSDVQIVDTDADAPTAEQLTATDLRVGGAVAGSFDGAGSLWVSVVEDGRPTSFRLPSDVVASEREIAEMGALDDNTLPGWFQPLVSPDDSMAIAWRGDFGGDTNGPLWSFAAGGEPYLIPNVLHQGDPTKDAVPLFGDLAIDEDGFRYAGITWGPESNAIAVWDALWTGSSQAPAGEPDYPDHLRVYFGRASEPEPINRTRVLDQADLPEGIGRVVDVAIAPDGQHLAVTVLYPIGGVLDEPRADLILVKRNLGAVADDVRQLGEGEGWFGPALYPPSNDGN